MQFNSSEGLKDVHKTISCATNYSPTAKSVLEANKVKRWEASPPQMQMQAIFLMIIKRLFTSCWVNGLLMLGCYTFNS